MRFAFLGMGMLNGYLSPICLRLNQRFLFLGPKGEGEDANEQHSSGCPPSGDAACCMLRSALCWGIMFDGLQHILFE